MQMRFGFFVGLAALGTAWALHPSSAAAADCSKGSAEEQVACLNRAVAELTAKVETLTKDALKWNDRITLVNEDMRLYPRCLDNPGPNSPNITDVFANSCAKVPAQTWMVRKSY
jgi:hypothetical protein